jgi:hypothetical protein
MDWLASKGFTESQFQDFVIDITDSGVDNGTTTPFHPNLFARGNSANPSRIVYARLEGTTNNPGSTLKGCDVHGTLNAHIIAGYDDLQGFPHTDDTGFSYGLGTCPFARFGSSVIFDPNLFTFPNYTDLQARAYRDGARISNNSWGADVGGGYDQDAQEFDALVRDSQPEGSAVPAPGNQEMVIVVAAGNIGFNPQSINSPSTAKNVLSVGAAENVRAMGGPDLCNNVDNASNNLNDIASFSSRGPCADGRHKPDLMAPGTRVTGGVPQAPDFDPNLGSADPCFLNDASGICGGLSLGGTRNLFWPRGQQWFTTCSGTSQAAPAVSGACALLRQFLARTSGAPPSPAMTKAYLVNSARYLTGVAANDTLWSDTQGMGGLNLAMAFDSTPRALRDQLAGDLFTASGQARIFKGHIIDPNQPFRATLAWTDAPGSTTGSAYNNNLDLVITVGQTTYKGNVFSGPYSIPGGTSDSGNNLESVFFPAGARGEFTLEVRAVNINSDAVPNNGTSLDQDFALVVYNAAFGNSLAISQPVYENGSFSILVETVIGRNYALEYKSGIEQTEWTSLPGVPGSGGIQSLKDPAATDQRRFYRVRQY